MEGQEHLTPYHVKVAQTFFGLAASRGYVVAGGAALLASALISRPTQDLDFFASAPVESVEEARDAFINALAVRAMAVTSIHVSPTFAGSSSVTVRTSCSSIWR